MLLVQSRGWERFRTGSEARGAREAVTGSKPHRTDAVLVTEGLCRLVLEATSQLQGAHRLESHSHFLREPLEPKLG